MKKRSRIATIISGVLGALVAVLYGLDQAAAPVVMPLLTGHPVTYIGITISGACGELLRGKEPDDLFCNLVCGAIDLIDDNHCGEAHDNETQNPRAH